MTKFSYVTIGAHFGVHLEKDLNFFSGNKILLVEPVPYNIEMLKENISANNNIFIEQTAIGEKDEVRNFYYVKGDSIHKLGKHWASGIGSFSKKHILDHRSKRFQIEEEDIEMINLNCMSFKSLMEKYSISEIEKLQIDVEGAEYEILKSIDYNKINIKNILFESKHMDGTFFEGAKLKEIKKILFQSNYSIKKIDKENTMATKN